MTPACGLTVTVVPLIDNSGDGLPARTPETVPNAVPSDGVSKGVHGLAIIVRSVLRTAVELGEWMGYESHVNLL
jgi:hypothetical protein